MNRILTSQRATLLALLISLATNTQAGAQQQTTALAAGMAANTKQLKQYTLKQRTETYYKGELKVAKIDEVHYDASGERVTVPLDEQKTESESRRRGPGSRLIAKKIAGKQEEMKEYVQRLMALASRYLAPNPDKLQAALATAEMTTSGGSTQARIVIRNYVKNGDSMTMTFDSATHQPVKTELSTTLETDPISIVLVFDQLRNGPNYPEKTVVKSGARELEVRVLTYEYRL